MGIFAKIFNTEPVHPAEVKAFGRTGRGSGRAAEAWAKQGGNSRKTIAQQQKEWRAEQKKGKK
jgi:hypothetical protein